MPSEEMQEKMVDELINRIEDLNRTILTEIGKQIKHIGTLTPSQAHKLAQIILYGEDMNKVARTLAKITNMSVNDIYKIFKQTAIENQEFARQFYKAKNVKFIPYSENKDLQKQVNALATLTANRFKNIMNSTGYVLDNKFIPIGKVYTEVLDKAILSVSQGKTSYQEEMFKAMKQLANKGMRVRLDKNGNPTGTKVIDFESGYTRRADTQIRMNLLDGIKEMSNELQQQFGEEFGADGVEISVHEHPAPDHAPIQGHQYSKEAFEKLNASLKRPISTLNCYHYIFSIVLGVSEPEYTQEQLDQINRDNEKGFKMDGKHYTQYEGTQMQRRLETKVRQLKDRQIVARAMGDEETVGNCQRKIREIMERISRKEREKSSNHFSRNNELCEEVFGINILYNVCRVSKL